MNLMNIFKKTRPSNTTDKEIMGEDQHIDQNIFIETNDPSVTENSIKEKTASRIEKFLRIDFEWYGYSDGYTDPSGDIIEKKLKSIRSDFRLELDRSIDEMRSRLSEAKLYQVSILGMPGRMEDEIKEKIRQIENAIKELELQKVLSIDDEGMLASAINRYSIGYT